MAARRSTTRVFADWKQVGGHPDDPLAFAQVLPGQEGDVVDAQVAGVQRRSSTSAHAGQVRRLPK